MVTMVIVGKGKAMYNGLNIFETIITEDTLFFYLGFLSQTFTIHRTPDEGEPIPLTSFYYFHPLQRHLDISGEVTTERSLLDIACKRTLNRSFGFRVQVSNH